MSSSSCDTNLQLDNNQHEFPLFIKTDLIFRRCRNSDISRDEAEHLVLEAVRRCGNEAERSRNRKLQCVGGTHTAQIGLAGPALARRLGPVCLKSLRKGQIKDRARGHNTAYTLSEAAACTCMRTTTKKHRTDLLPWLLLIAFYISPLLFQFQSPHNKAPSTLAKHLAVGKVNSSLQLNAVPNMKQATVYRVV